MFEGVLGRQRNASHGSGFELCFTRLFSLPPSLVFYDEHRAIGHLTLTNARYTPCDSPPFSFTLEVPVDNADSCRSISFAASSDAERLSWAVQLGSVGILRQTEARSRRRSVQREASSSSLVSKMIERAESNAALAVDQAALAVAKPAVRQRLPSTTAEYENLHPQRSGYAAAGYRTPERESAPPRFDMPALVLEPQQLPPLDDHPKAPFPQPADSMPTAHWTLPTMYACRVPGIPPVT